MVDFNLIRLRTGDQGTMGVLTDYNKFFTTVELPDKDNKPCVSCIPAGLYLVEAYRSVKYGIVYCIQNVPYRTGILIHNGNFAGDVEKNYLTHSKGCVIIGKKFGILENQIAVLESRQARRELEQYLGMNKFTLNIRS